MLEFYDQQVLFRIQKFQGCRSSASPGSEIVTDPDLGHKDAETKLELQAVEKISNAFKM
jgi:hypothetical protein